MYYCIISSKGDADNNTYQSNNWAHIIKSSLNEMGLGYIWERQEEIDISIEPIKTRILDIYKQTWYSNINNSRRLLSYSIYKHSFGVEQYLNHIHLNKYRTALTKFRISSHDLAIEKGRHNNIPRDLRMCNHCNMRVIEDEYHFLLVCPKYYDIRRQFLKPYFCRWPTLKKFELVMMSNSPKILKQLAKYIYHAFKARNST